MLYLRHLKIIMKNFEKISIKLEELNGEKASNFIKIVATLINESNEITLERLAPMNPGDLRAEQQLCLEDIQSMLGETKLVTPETSKSTDTPKRRRRSKKETSLDEETTEPLRGQVEFSSEEENDHHMTEEVPMVGEEEGTAIPENSGEEKPMTDETAASVVEVMAKSEQEDEDQPAVEEPETAEDSEKAEATSAEDAASVELVPEEETGASDEVSEPAVEDASPETHVLGEEDATGKAEEPVTEGSLTAEAIAKAGAVLCTYRPEFAANAVKKQWAPYGGKPLLKMANECPSMMRVIVRNIRLGKEDRIFITDEGIEAIQILNEALDKGMLPAYHE